MNVSVAAIPITSACLFHPLIAEGTKSSKRSQICKNGSIKRYVESTVNRQKRLSLIFICIKLAEAWQKSQNSLIANLCSKSTGEGNEDVWRKMLTHERLLPRPGSKIKVWVENVSVFLQIASDWDKSQNRRSAPMQKICFWGRIGGRSDELVASFVPVYDAHQDLHL